METDRLPEEKQRGLSITPGFAHCTYPEGVLDFVDAPGHADFVQSMIGAASGAQAALVVISLMDGIAAQTAEHLKIAGFLGISKTVIALSKADMLDLSEREARVSDIRNALSQSQYATAPMVVCSAQSGAGIEELSVALRELLSGTPKRTDALQCYLPIDRAFTLPGQGAIITGTLQGKALGVDEDVMLQPAGRAVSIRSLEGRANARKVVHPGERMAANLRGIAAQDISSGSVLCATGMGGPSRVVDVYLDIPHAQTKELKHMQELRVLFGTSVAVAQLRLMKDKTDVTRFAQLRFNKPISCFAGQKAIIRRLSPAETIGGATFLDPQAEPAKSGDTLRLKVLRAAYHRDIDSIAKTLIEIGKGCVERSAIARLARIAAEDLSTTLDATFLDLNKEYISSTEDIDIAKARLLKAVGDYHLKYPLKPMAPRSMIAKPGIAAPLYQYVEELVVTENLLRRQANMLALQDHDPLTQLSLDQRQEMSDLETSFRLAGLTASAAREDQNPDLMQLLTEEGILIPLANIALKQTLLFHIDTITQAATTLAAAYPKGQSFTTSQARRALATSRRIIVPLLEYFDSIGVTDRQEDTRQIVDLNKVSHTTRS